jgi:hypothetical protein
MMRQSPLSSSAIQCVFSNITHVSGLRLFLRRSLSLCPRVCIQVSVSEFYFSSFRINTAATSGSLMMYEHLCCLIISAFWLSNFVDPVSGKVYTNIIRGTLSLPLFPTPHKNHYYLKLQGLLQLTLPFWFIYNMYVPLVNNLIYWCTAQIGFRMFLV